MLKKFIFFILSAFLGLGPVFASENGSEETIFTNKNTVSEKMINLYENSLRGEAVSHFSQDGPIETQGDFWNRCLRGITPNEWLRANAINRILELESHLILFHKYGLQKERVSLPQMMNIYSKENSKRQMSFNSSKPVYGLKKFNYHTFMNYFISINRREVIRRLSRDRRYDELGLMEIYSKYIDDFREPDEYVLKLIKVPSDLFNQEHITELHTLFDLSDENSRSIFYDNRRLIIEDKVFTHHGRKSDSIVWTDVINIIKHSNEGDVFLSKNLSGEKYLVKIVEVRAGKARLFDDVRDILVNRFSEKEYDEELRKIRETLEAQIVLGNSKEAKSCQY